MPAQSPRLAARPIQVAALAGAALLVCFALGSVYLARPDVRARALDFSASAARDVAIVPGTFVSSAGRPGPMLRARLEAAREVLATGRVHAILVSGNESSREATSMQRWLVERGVDPERILVDPAGTRTIETMRNAARRFGVSRAIVCTENLSMPRTLFLAQRAGIDAVGLSIPTPLARSPRWVATEALKSVLAFFETLLPVST
jgi:vancomycin permeability regulator SanA